MGFTQFDKLQACKKGSTVKKSMAIRQLDGNILMTLFLWDVNSQYRGELELFPGDVKDD